jgi:hypothetical protein
MKEIFFKELKKNDRKFIYLNEDNVTYYNSLQVLQSYRQIYCLSNNFDLADDIYKQNPNLGLLSKNRIYSQ